MIMAWFNETLIYLICKLLVVEQKYEDFVIHKVLWMAIEESITWVYDALRSLLCWLSPNSQNAWSTTTYQSRNLPRCSVMMASKGFTIRTIEGGMLKNNDIVYEIWNLTITLNKRPDGLTSSAVPLLRN